MEFRDDSVARVGTVAGSAIGLQ